MRKEITEAEKKITKSLLQDGPYTHNIISLVLRDLSQKVSLKAANKIVDSFGLSAYGIHKVKEAKS